MRAWIAIALLLIPATASALELRAGDQVTLPAGEVVTEDTYIAAGAVSQIAPVKGDLFAAGGQVLSQGDVGGDLFMAGGGIMTVGTTSDDLRVAGGNVTIHGAVLGDAVVFGGQVLISGEVRGDLIAYGGTVRIEAPIRGSVRAGGSTVVIDAPIQGSVRVDAEDLRFGANGSIGGDLAYSAISRTEIPPGAVDGDVAFSPRADVREAAENGLVAFLSLWFVIKFVMLLIGSLLIGYFFHGYSVDLIARCRAKPIQEFALGLTTMIVLPVVSLFLVVILIGLPLGLLGLLGFFALGVFAHLIAPIVFGSFLYSWMFSVPPTVSWKTTLLGATLFYLIWFVPFVGWIARAYFIFLAIGATISFKWDIARKWH